MIQRFNVRQAGGGFEWYADDNGPWVSAEAHEMELRACEARVREETQQEFRGFAEAAWAKALAAAWLAVDSTRTGFLMAIGASPEPPERYWIPKDDALDAIDALKGE